MTEIIDSNFAEDYLTAADLVKIDLLKSGKEEDLNSLAELLNQMLAKKAAKISQEKDEFYSKQLASKELESDLFYNHLPCGYFSTEGNGTINKINDTLLAWLGYTKEDIIGKVTWQSLLSVGGKMYFETHYSPLLQMQGFVKEISFEMVKKDKTRLPILINTKQIRDEKGNVQINYSTVFEVSQRKSYEKELLLAKRNIEKQNKLIEYTFRNNSIPIYYILEDASFYDFNNIAAENLGYTREEFFTLKVYDLDKDYDEKKLASLWAKLKVNKKISIKTQQKKKDGTLIDVIVTANYVKFGDLELNCSYVLDITEKKKQEEELKLVDYTFNNSAMPIFLVKEDSSIYNINLAAARDLGYTQEELKGKKIIELNANFDKEKWALHWADIKAKGSKTIETTPTKKDGTLTNFIIISNYVKHGDLELICSYSTDITEKKIVLNQLKLTDFAFRNSVVPIHFIQKDGSIYDFNESACALLGYTKEEYKKLKVYHINRTLNAENFTETWENIFLRNDAFVIETTLTTKDNQIIDVEIRTNAIKFDNIDLICSTFIDVTEKKRLEEQMKLVDYTFRNSTTPINIITKDASIFDFNEAAPKLLGYTKEEYKAITIPEIDPDYQYGIWPIHWEELKKAKSLSFETTLRKKNGDMINANIEANFIQYGDKELNCVFFTDITEKKKAEEDLKLMDFAFKKAATPILLLLPKGEFYNFNDSLLNLLGYSQKEFSEMNLLDIATEMDEASCIKQWDEIRENRSLIFNCHFKRKDGVLLDVEITSNLINYNEYEVNFCYINDITEKKKAEEEIKRAVEKAQESDAKFKVYAQKSPIAIYTTDINGDCIYANETWLEMAAMQLEDVLGKGWINALHPEDLEYVTENWYKSVESNGDWNYEYRFLNSNKNIIWVNGTAKKLFNDKNEHIGYLGSNVNITERKKAEIKLIESENYLRTILNTAPECVKIVNRKGEFLYMNPAGLAIVEADNEQQVLGAQMMDMVNKEYQKGFNDLIKEVFNGNSGTLEFEITGLKGSHCFMETHAVPLKDATGKIVNLLGVTRNISRRKRDEKEKKQLTERLQLATKSAQLGIWDWDIKNNVAIWDEGMYRLCDIAENEFNSVFEGFISRVHQEDRKQLLYEMELGIANKKEYEPEFRVVWKDSSVHYLNASSIIERDNEGNAIRMIVVNWDVTAEKERIKHLKLLESVILNTNDSILITEAEPYDLPGPRILFVNKAFTEMTGYSAEEVIGKTPRMLQNEDTDRKELDKLRIALSKWEPCEITVSNSRKNGEKFWNKFSVAPVANEKGWYTHWIAVERDVTEEIEAAIEKEKLLKELVENNLELKQFSYITSHNLRAPLTNLVGICDIIKPEQGTDAFTLQLIDAFKTSTQHLNETLNDLIEVLIIKENRNIHKDQLTFEEILIRITESLSLILLEKKVIINADFSAAPSVDFANAYLESIFLNLFTNAVKYRHPDRDPIITIKTSKEPNGNTQLTFADNGIGINMALAKDKIFGLYKRFHNNADSKGIGLYLVHSQITALGGKIEVESAVNIGTTFTLTFK